MQVSEPELSPTADFVYKQRYLKRYPDGEIAETPGGLLDRVAVALAKAYPADEAYWQERFFDMMVKSEALPNSPTLFNAGNEQPMMSACFTFHVNDSLGQILEIAKIAGLVQKHGGGVGYGLSRIRARGSHVSSTGNMASGPVGFMPLYQAVAKTITQGGKRQGAQMAILRCDHPDIEEFILCKNDDPEQFNTFNISVAITDAFMEAVAEDKFGQRRCKEGELLKLMAESAWKTGDPGCYFIDTAERFNPTPHLGQLESTNPCGEVPLLHGEACNLGSINLVKMLRSDTSIDWSKLDFTVRTMVRMLDAVVSLNWFPHSMITAAVNRTRKIGLGVMGWADMLALKGVPYSDSRALSLAEDVMGEIQRIGHEESHKLALELGCYPGTPATTPTIRQGRNATVTCIAPTGSIAILAGCSSGIEPHPFLTYKRNIGNKQAGNFATVDVVEPIVGRLLAAGSNFQPELAADISWRWHIDHQAAFQRHVDLAVSKTINMPNQAEPIDIFHAYRYAWQAGCKGITVYRQGSRQGEVISQ